MRVILLEDVKKQGKKGQTISVKDGYGNYLITNNLAVLETKGSKAVLDKQNKDAKEASEKLIQECQNIKEKLTKFKTIKKEEIPIPVVELKKEKQPASVTASTVTNNSTSLNVVATCYTPGDPGCTGITYTGTKASRGTIAVDTKVIPFGTKLYIPGYGYGVAADTGGAIKGNKIEGYLNGSLIAQAYDDSYLQGSFGFVTLSQSASYRNIQVEAERTLSLPEILSNVNYTNGKINILVNLLSPKKVFVFFAIPHSYISISTIYII